MSTYEENRALVVEHMHGDGRARRALPGEVFDAVFAKGDGFGAGLSRETLAGINSGADWSHVRDSSPEAWKAMADELRSRGYGETA